MQAIFSEYRISTILEAVNSCTKNQLERKDIDQILQVASTTKLPKEGSIKIQKKVHNLARNLLLTSQGEVYILMTRVKAKKDALLGEGTFKAVKKTVCIQLNGKEKPLVLALGIFRQSPQKKATESTFPNEVKCLRQFVGNERIVQLRHSHNDGPRAYMVMKLYPNDLRTEIASGGCKSYLDQLEMALSCARAVEAVHQKKMVHRDIKPRNFLIRQEYGGVALGDFGFARSLLDPSRLKRICGTLDWLSPEIAKNCKKLGDLYRATTLKNDIFSLGLVFHLLAKGTKIPFQCDTNLLLNLTDTEVKRYLEQTGMREDYILLIEGMLKVDPQERFDINEVILRLKRLILTEHLYSEEKKNP